MRMTLSTSTLLGFVVYFWLALAVPPASVSARIRDQVQGQGASAFDKDTDQGAAAAVPWPIVVPAARLHEARQHPGSTHNYTTEFPPWANRTLIAIGQRFLRKNFAGFEYAAALTTLLVGADTQRVLISGGNTTEIPKASRRYLVNVLNFWYWATADLGSEELFESLNLIHAVHAKVGHQANRKRDMFSKPLIHTPPPGQNPLRVQTSVWQAFERDLLASPLRAFRRKPIFPPRNGGTLYPLNQFAMATQLWAFIAFPAMSPEKVLIGRTATDEELWGYIHFWAFIGRGLGIDDKYNLCLQPDLATAQIYFREVLQEYFIPALLDITYEQKAVMEVAVAAAGEILGDQDLGFVLYRVCIDILNIECHHMRRQLSPIARTVNLVLERVVVPITNFDFPKPTITFVTNSLINAQTIRHFDFNILQQGNFSRGILALDAEILRTSDVHWKPTPQPEAPSQYL